MLVWPGAGTSAMVMVNAKFSLISHTEPLAWDLLMGSEFLFQGEEREETTSKYEQTQAPVP